MGAAPAIPVGDRRRPSLVPGEDLVPGVAVGRHQLEQLFIRQMGQSLTTHELEFEPDLVLLVTPVVGERSRSLVTISSVSDSALPLLDAVTRARRPTSSIRTDKVTPARP